MVQYTITTRVDGDVLKVFWSYCSEVGASITFSMNASERPLSTSPLKIIWCVHFSLLSTSSSS